MTLFIGNISRLSTEADIRKLFSGYGEILNLKLMIDRITRRSRGYAYVNMPETEALQAVQDLNSQPFMGSTLIIGVASKKQNSDIDWLV